MHPVSDDATGHEGDVLPEELDVTAYVGPYLFPSPRRRRIAGTIYAVLALLCVIGWLAGSNVGLLLATIFLALVAVYHFVTAWPLSIDQTEALLIATRTVGFPVGHSALLWQGPLQWLLRQTDPGGQAATQVIPAGQQVLP